MGTLNCEVEDSFLVFVGQMVIAISGIFWRLLFHKWKKKDPLVIMATDRVEICSVFLSGQNVREWRGVTPTRMADQLQAYRWWPLIEELECGL